MVSEDVAIGKNGAEAQAAQDYSLAHLRAKL
jgi:hypothetical protein